MTKAIGLKQGELLSKYVAPVLNFDLGPIWRGAYSLFSSIIQNRDEVGVLEERILDEVDGLTGNPNMETAAERQGSIRQLLRQYSSVVDRKDMEPVYSGLMRIFEVGEVA